MESETNNFLNWVEIKNFKSIKDLRMDCKRVNVFIGKPNVGKSNILEGLGLLGAEYSGSKFMEGSVRYEQIRHLFYDNDPNNLIEILTDEKWYLLTPAISPNFYSGESNEAIAKISNFSLNSLSREMYLDRLAKKHQERDVRSLIHRAGDASIDLSEENGQQRVFSKEQAVGQFRTTKKYDFANLTKFANTFQDFLIPPNGPNLYEVIRRNPDLWDEFARLFVDQNLELVLYDQNQEILLQKKAGHIVWQYPFFSIADTFRRFMFYITAIKSNKNSVIIFEEPEVHSFPPYTQDVAYRMIYSETNQFFVSTHSPYLLQTLVENLEDDQLNVFVTYYENYETKVKALTSEELSFVQEYSTDVFFNLDRFIPNAHSATVS